MYIDDGGETEIRVEVDGQQYTAPETVDHDHDGVLDAAEVDTGDGGHLLYVDTEGDGTADLAVDYDASDHVTSEARFDPQTGSWVGTPPADQAGDGAGIAVDAGAGQVDAGSATIDSDGDGHNDTVLVHDGGDTVLYTDSDRDGEADVATVITSDGRTETFEHTGPGAWTPVKGGEGTDPAGDAIWGQAAGSAAAVGVVRIDATTGQWISFN